MAALLLFFCFYSIKQTVAVEDYVRITKKQIVYRDNNKIAVMVETEGFDGVDITIRVIFVDLDGKNEIVKELGVPKFNKIDAPVKDMTGYEEGVYLFVIEAKHGDSWVDCAVDFMSFIFVPCQD